MPIPTFRAKRRYRKSQDDFQAYHVAARTDRARLAALLSWRWENGQGPWPWLVTEDHDWREAFRRLNARFTTTQRVHYSLEAHYERLKEVAVDCLARFVNPEAEVSVSFFKGEVLEIFKGFAALDELNKEAWVREQEANDTAGTVGVVLANARRTVEDLRPEATLS